MLVFPLFYSLEVGMWSEMGITLVQVAIWESFISSFPFLTVRAVQYK